MVQSHQHKINAESCSLLFLSRSSTVTQQSFAVLRLMKGGCYQKQEMRTTGRQHKVKTEQWKVPVSVQVKWNYASRQFHVTLITPKWSHFTACTTPLSLFLYQTLGGPLKWRAPTQLLIGQVYCIKWFPQVERRTRDAPTSLLWKWRNA